MTKWIKCVMCIVRNGFHAVSPAHDRVGVEAVGFRANGMDPAMSVCYEGTVITATEEMQSTNGEFHGKSVLLVDDEEDVRDAIELLMSQGLGMLVTSAGNGDGALEMYRSGRFDYVVTDYNMPGQRGDALAGAIKQLNSAQRIVMISGFPEAILRNGRLPACIDALVTKPCSLSHLVEALRGETRQA